MSVGNFCTISPALAATDRWKDRKESATKDVQYHESLGLGRLIRGHFSAGLVHRVLKFTIFLAVVEVAKQLLCLCAACWRLQYFRFQIL